MNQLIIPARYSKEKEAYAEHSAIEFRRKLEAFLSENQHEKDPYFIMFKQNVNIYKPNQMNAAFSIYRQRPPFITRSLVFWVDNSRGLCELLWAVNRQRNVKFNTKAAERLKGVLRSAAD